MVIKFKLKKLMIIQGIFVFLILNLNFINSGDPIISEWVMDSMAIGDVFCDNSEGNLRWVIDESGGSTNYEDITDESGNCMKNSKTCCPDGYSCIDDSEKYVCRKNSELCSDYLDLESCENVEVNSDTTKRSTGNENCGLNVLAIGSSEGADCNQLISCDCYWYEGECQARVTYGNPIGLDCKSDKDYECFIESSEVDDQCETTGNYNINLIKTLKERGKDEVITDPTLKKQYECEDINKPYPCSSLTRLSFYSVAQLVITFLIIFILYFLVVERKNTLRKANSQGKSNIDSKTQKKSRNKKNLKKSKKFSKK